MSKLDAPMPSCGDTSCEMLISPFPVPRTKPLAVRQVASKRQVILFDTSKPNSLRILEKTAAHLRARGIDVLGPIISKSDPSRAAASVVIDTITNREALVVCGIAD
jgi:hypothetical protein